MAMMEGKSRLARRGTVLAVALAMAPSAAWADPAPWTALGLSGLVDLRGAIADGEASWRHRGTGKLRFGGNGGGDMKGHVALGDAHLLWQPRVNGFSAHVDARLQPGAGKDFGLNEGWIAWRQRGQGRRCRRHSGRISERCVLLPKQKRATFRPPHART